MKDRTHSIRTLLRLLLAGDAPVYHCHSCGCIEPAVGEIDGEKRARCARCGTEDAVDEIEGLDPAPCPRVRKRRAMMELTGGGADDR